MLSKLGVRRKIFRLGIQTLHRSALQAFNGNTTTRVGAAIWEYGNMLSKVSTKDPAHGGCAEWRLWQPKKPGSTPSLFQSILLTRLSNFAKMIHDHNHIIRISTRSRTPLESILKKTNMSGLQDCTWCHGQTINSKGAARTFQVTGHVAKSVERTIQRVTSSTLRRKPDKI